TGTVDVTVSPFTVAEKVSVAAVVPAEAFAGNGVSTTWPGVTGPAPVPLALSQVGSPDMPHGNELVPVLRLTERVAGLKSRPALPPRTTGCGLTVSVGAVSARVTGKSIEVVSVPAPTDTCTLPE